MIAAHLDNFLFLLLVAVAVLFPFLAKAAGKTRTDQAKQASTPIPRTAPPISPFSQLTREKLRKREVIPRENVPAFTVTRAENIVPPNVTDASAFEVHQGSSPIGPPPIIRTVADVTQTV